MANLAITDLTTLTTVASGDYVPIVDVSDTTQSSSGTTKKITRSNLLSGVGTWTKETPSGSFNGVNVTYSLAHTPITSSGTLYVNGQTYVEGTDYTITGLSLNQITLATVLPTNYSGSFIFHYQY